MATRAYTAQGGRSDPAIEAKYKDLDAKYKLLVNDRKAIHETAENKIAQNNAIIDALTQENKTLKKTLISISKAPPPRPNTAPAGTRLQKQTQKKVDERDQLSAACTDTGIQVLRVEVNKLKLRLDEARHQYNTKSSLLDKREDALALIQKEIDRPEPVVEAGMERIRDLENRYDDACIKEREATSVRNTYNAILARLKEEKIYFNTQILNISAMNKNRDADIKQLETYLQEAIAASSLVYNEYEEYKEYCDVDKQSRRAALMRRRQEVEAAVEDERRLEKQRLESRLSEEAEMKAAAEAAGNIRIDEASSDYDDDDLGTAGTIHCKRRAKLEYFKTVLSKLKENTGISDIKEFVDKCISQPINRSSLQNLTIEFNQKLTGVAQDIAYHRTLNSDAQFTADTSGSRRVVDRLEFNISEEKFRNSSLQQRYKFTLDILGQLARGAQHICELLLLVKDDSSVEANLLPMPMAVDGDLQTQEKAVDAVITKLETIRDKIRVLATAVKITDIPSSTMRITQREQCALMKGDEEPFNLVDGSLVKAPDEEGDTQINTEIMIDLPGVGQRRDEFDFTTTNQPEVDTITTTERSAIKRRSELFAYRARQKAQENAY